MLVHLSAKRSSVKVVYAWANERLMKSSLLSSSVSFPEITPSIWFSNWSMKPGEVCSLVVSESELKSSSSPIEYRLAEELSKVFLVHHRYHAGSLYPSSVYETTVKVRSLHCIISCLFVSEPSEFFTVARAQVNFCETVGPIVVLHEVCFGTQPSATPSALAPS